MLSSNACNLVSKENDRIKCSKCTPVIMFKSTQKNYMWESEPTLIFLAKDINIQLVCSKFQLSSQNEVKPKCLAIAIVDHPLSSL